MSVVWINGAFGAGKTTVARELVRGRTDATIVDPERVGWIIQRFRRGDYQDTPVWRAATRSLVEAASRITVAVVPMTVIVPGYFDDIVGWLRSRGTEVKHVTLVASEDTLRERLLDRAENAWALGRARECVRALRDPRFGEHVATDGRSVADVVGDVRRIAFA